MQTMPAVEVELASRAQCREWVTHKCQILDVRGEAEFAADHYPGALNIPLNKLADWARQQNCDAPLVLYCGKGIRAQMAINQLKDLGFTQLANGGSLAQLKETLG